MNPRWVVVRPRHDPIKPLTRGAVETISYGLHARRRDDTVWTLALAAPDNALDRAAVPGGSAVTWALLGMLERIALRPRDRRSVVVWCHGLADRMVDLFAGVGSAFAASTEPRVAFDGSGLVVAWQGYHESGPRRVELRDASRDLDAALGAEAAAAGVPPFRLSLLRGPTGAATLTFHGRRAIRLLDSRSFVRAELQTMEVRSLLAGLAYRDDRLAQLHALHPAIATRAIGERIAEVWTVLDVPISPTPASTGAKLFRRTYLSQPLRKVPYAVESAAEQAFHGGKIGLWTLPNTTFDLVHVYDMRSAYAAAMTAIPSFYSGEWVTLRSMRQPSSIALLPGFTRVTGYVKACRYPIIPSHCGDWLRGCRVERTWITNYEFQEAVNSGEFEPEEWVSWCWIEKGTNSSPWKAFSEDVFRERDLCTDALRGVYKGSLVGLYGKTVQRTAIPPVPPDGTMFEYGVPIAYCNRGEPDSDRHQYFRAGGFYYPVVGCLVTGLVRAWMHRVEHAYQAVHSAVDAVHTLVPLPDRLIGPGLGQWRYLGSGRATYRAANSYRVVGPGGWRKAAAAGVRAPRTDDESGQLGQAAVV